MAMRPKTEMSPPPATPSPSDQRDAVIEELRKGSQLAEFLRQQVELIPEDRCRDAALANVSNISTALASSLSVLQSEKEQYCSSSSYDPGHASGASGGGVRNGPVARSRNRKAKHRRGTYGEDLPIKEILTEAPENDRFHWRKYGEKKILHADFPRLYYRCGYSDEHKCPAKKYVQQQNSGDQPMFLVTLINDHTCDTLFPDEDQDQPPSSPSSANNSQVLDFSKASLSSAVGVSRLKEEEDADMSVTVPSYNYTYDELSSSSLPFLSPKQWEMEMDIKSLFRRHSGDGN
ncbi:probable WRKY transcription factor 3 [Hordeum vulgare subsp. vulgare]|uniref:WRKY domain-containing protein n=1 Tax=Hordeum vulgare subsp. vulgare TaxID=112509 RepID=A0A8I6X534_HORVV|nr:probable WRKY transcription factor 3 [Hordeum vulgare subsp. vulgare]